MVTAAFIPADKVVLTPLEVPSAGDLKKVYTACPSTNVTFWFFTSQNCKPLFPHSENKIFKDRLAVYVPGSGILFKDGICATLSQTTGTDGSVTLTITGA